MNESRTRVVGDTVVEGRLLSVNVGTVRQIELAGQARTTAIWKLPVSGRVAVRGVNLAGDDQADRRAHGGPDKAVYAYAREDYAWSASLIERSIPACSGRTSPPKGST